MNIAGLDINELKQMLHHVMADLHKMRADINDQERRIVEVLERLGGKDECV